VNPRRPELPGGSPASGLNRAQRAVASTHLAVSLLAGGLVAAAAALRVGWSTASMIAWVVAAGVFLVWQWRAIWAVPATATAWLAQREDPSRPVRDLVLLLISFGTVMTVALVIFRAHENSPMRIGLGVACIAASWLVLHTVLTLRYARLYYTDPQGGLEFNQSGDPTFRDFAYVAFTIGMTFQVSDTTVQKPEIRATVLEHALASFVYDAVLIAVTVNVIAGLSA
jgi:uncharacterized membrane protein